MVYWVSVLTQIEFEKAICAHALFRSIIGPIIGGALARPCISYPDLFARGTIWDRYPYLLPNLFSAIMVCMGVIIGLLFLEETHVERKHQRDRGRELGDYIVSLFCGSRSCQTSRSNEKEALPEDLVPLIRADQLKGYRTADSTADIEEQLPAYQSVDSSPRLGPRNDVESGIIPSPLREAVKVNKIFTKPVIMNIASYGILAL